MHVREKIWKYIVAAPVMLPAALALFGTIVVLCAMVNVWSTVVVLPIATVVTALGSYFLYRWLGYAKAPAPSKEEKYSALIVLLGVVIWISFNALYSSQNIYMGRDAQIYAENALWLMRYETPQFEASGIFGAYEGIEESHTIRMMLLPYLLSIAGNIGGDSFMLHINPIFGGAAILALFAFARLLVRDRWAVVAAIAFAATLPLMYFSRDNYTEPMATTFIFASLALTVTAWQKKASLLFAAAGFVAGAGMLVRFDSVMPMIGIALTFILLLVLAKRTERRETLRYAAYFIAGLLATTTVGMLNLMLFSEYYYNTHAHLIWPQFWALGALIGLGGVAVTLAWKTKIVSWVDKKTFHWRGYAVMSLFIGIIAFLASRPLWMTERKERFNGLIHSIETSLGMAADGYRTYAEYTLNWIVWYVGPVLAIGAVVGIALILYKAMYQKTIALFLSITVLLSAAAVYVNIPSITPDQIWAARRFLPVIFPAVIIFGVFFLDWLSQKKLPYGLNASMFVGILATLGILGPLFISQPFLQKRTHVPQLAQITDFCAAVPKDAAILWVGATAAIEMPQPTRTFCDVPAAAVDEITFSELRDAQQSVNNAGRTLLVGTLDRTSGLPDGAGSFLTEMHAIEYQDLEYQMMKPPRAMRTEPRTLFLGQVESDGSISSFKQGDSHESN